MVAENGHFLRQQYTPLTEVPSLLPTSEIPLLQAIVTRLGGVTLGTSEVPCLQQIVQLLDDGAISDSLPSQTGHAGEYLTTDGASASWGAIPSGGDVVASGALTANSLIIGQGGTTVSAATTGTGVLTALGVNAGSAGSVVVNGGALGTPTSGTLTNATGLPTAGLLDDAVTYAKMQNISAASRLLGRGSAAGAGNAEELTLGSGITLTGTVLSATGLGGDMIKAVYDPRNLSLITGLPGSDNGVNVGGLGGNLDMHGGNAGAAANGGASGEIHVHGGHSDGITQGGQGGSIHMESDGVFNGGDINTSAATADGGDITTADGGGSINTQGVGLVELGVSGTRTTLIGTATSNRAISLPNATGVLALNPMTTAGDIIFGGASGVETRLAIGTALQVLQVNAGATAPEWVAVTGTGSVARATSPTFVTPLLGTPTSGTLTNCTGLPAAGVVGTAAILGANTFTALQTITQAAANAGILASTGYSLTGASAVNMVDLAGTWNTTGVPTAIKLNITDTASNGSSLLLDLQKDASSVFRVTKTGQVFCSGNVEGGGGFISTSAGGFFKVNSRFVLEATADGVSQLHSSNGIAFSSLELLSVKTGNPSGGTAAFWKMGSSITSGTSTLDTTGYVEIDIGGTLVKLARVTNS